MSPGTWRNTSCVHVANLVPTFLLLYNFIHFISHFHNFSFLIISVLRFFTVVSFIILCLLRHYCTCPLYSISYPGKSVLSCSFLKLFSKELNHHEFSIIYFPLYMFSELILHNSSSSYSRLLIMLHLLNILFRFKSGIWGKFTPHRDTFYLGCWQNVSSRPNKEVIQPDYHFWSDIH